jgi:plastocyanin
VPFPRQTPRTLGILAALLLGAAACDATPERAEDRSQGAEEDDRAGGAADDPLVADDEVTDADERQAVWADELRIADRRYDPPELLAGAGRELVVVNEDDEAHTVTSFDASFEAEVAPGGRVEIEVPEEPGAYPFSCRFHPEMGGMLEVM